jgi:hypothetical protein
MGGAGIRWTRSSNLGISLASTREVSHSESHALKWAVEDLVVENLKQTLAPHGAFANFRVVPDSPWEELVVHGVRPSGANFDDINAALGTSSKLILIKNLIKPDHSPDAVHSVKITLPMGNTMCM